MSSLVWMDVSGMKGGWETHDDPSLCHRSCADSCKFLLLPSDVLGFLTILHTKFRGSRDENAVNLLALFCCRVAHLSISLGATDFRSSVSGASSRTFRCTNWCGIHHLLVVWWEARDFFLCVVDLTPFFFHDRFVFLCRRRGSLRKIGSSWINFVAQTVIQLWSRLRGRWSSLQFYCSSFWLLMVKENCAFLFAYEWQLVYKLIIVSNTLLTLKGPRGWPNLGLKMSWCHMEEI